MSFFLKLKLRLVSAQLSVKSHLGVIDNPLYDNAFQLISQIEKEDAQLACEGLLRLFSMSTNVLESGRLENKIRACLNEDMLVFGKLNFAKLHSTMGQICAFKGDNHNAALQFEKAIALFKELSDQARAKNEILQTTCYLLMASIAG